jgi:hypothetical protein
VQLNDPGRQRKSDAIARGKCFVLAAVERCEDMGQVCRRNADPIVFEGDHRPLLLKIDGDLALAVSGEFTGVLHEVGKCHFQQVFIAPDCDRISFFDVGSKLQFHLVIRIGAQDALPGVEQDFV